MLCRGLIKGHLYLDTPVDPFLLGMKDPWDPIARQGHGMHDATYFNHHYYLYFGVTPEIVLFLPFHFVTGKFITEATASFVFCVLGFIFSVLLATDIKRWYFKSTPGWVWLMSIFALGLTTMVPSLLRRASIWEVPITCGYMCAMAGLFCFARAFHAKFRALWLAWASLAFGAAIGARPVYLIGSFILALPLLYFVSEFGGWRTCWRNPKWWRLVASAVVPIACWGIVLALYNYARFGSIAEFGQKYQMAGDENAKLKLFSLSYIIYGLRIYFTVPAGCSPYFPFFTVIDAPTPPAGFLGVEDPYGIIPNIPFALFGLALLGTRETSESGGLFRWTSLSVLLFAIPTALIVSCFAAINNRYMVDFTPELIVLAVLGTYFLFSEPGLSGVRRLVLGATMVALLVYSVVFNVFVSLAHNELMRDEQPALYMRIAHASNRWSELCDRITGTRYGPLEIKVVMPQGKPGQLEAILATGKTFRSDYLYIMYDSPNLARFGFEHTSRFSLVGGLVHYKAGEVQTITIDMPSLYPPPAHPFFDLFAPREAHFIQRKLRVKLDNEVSIDGLAECYDATSREPSIGSSGGRGSFTQPFSGRIVSSRRLPNALPEPPPGLYGPVSLELILPSFKDERSEPLLSSGVTGLGDLVFVHYLNNHQISFGQDDWGGGARFSDPIEIDYRKTHVVEIDYGALYPTAIGEGWTGYMNRDRIVVRLDGKIVFDKPTGFHPSSPDDIQIGNNAIRASSSYPTFTGELKKSDRLKSSLITP